MLKFKIITLSLVAIALYAFFSGANLIGWVFSLACIFYMTLKLKELAIEVSRTLPKGGPF